MKKKYKKIHSLEDLQRHKLRLKKKLRRVEESISEKTEVSKLFFMTSDTLKGLFADKESSLEILGYLLPMGIKYITRQIRKNPKGKVNKKLILYSVLGGVSAFLAYKYMKTRENETKD